MLKSEKSKAIHTHDRSKHLEQLDAIEKKLIDDELKNMEHNEKIKVNVSINRQFEQMNSFKQEQQRAERARQNEERRCLDEQIKQANFAD